MAKRRAKRRGLLLALAEGLLSLIDALCGALAGGFMALVRLAGRVMALLLRALLALLRGALRLLALPARAIARGIRWKDPLQACRELTGEEFEAYCALLLRDNGYRRVRLTPLSGDQGADILCVKAGESYAVQCKNFAGDVGNGAVQEAAAGRAYYGCDRAAVLCPGAFTPSAVALAEATDVDLWDGETLLALMKRSGRRP